MAPNRRVSSKLEPEAALTLNRRASSKLEAEAPLPDSSEETLTESGEHSNHSHHSSEDHLFSPLVVSPTSAQWGSAQDNQSSKHPSMMMQSAVLRDSAAESFTTDRPPRYRTPLALKPRTEEKRYVRPLPTPGIPKSPRALPVPPVPPGMQRSYPSQYK